MVLHMLFNIFTLIKYRLWNRHHDSSNFCICFAVVTAVIIVYIHDTCTPSVSFPIQRSIMAAKVPDSLV